MEILMYCLEKTLVHSFMFFLHKCIFFPLLVDHNIALEIKNKHKNSS